jgi:hypothetical protein
MPRRTHAVRFTHARMHAGSCMKRPAREGGSAQGSCAPAAPSAPRQHAGPTPPPPPRQEAQQLLLSAVRGAVAERSFEASVYHHMAAASVTLEQVNAADAHLAGLQRLLAAHRQREELLRAADAAGGGSSGNGSGGGGAEDDAMALAAPPDALPGEAPGGP